MRAAQKVQSKKEVLRCCHLLSSSMIHLHDGGLTPSDREPIEGLIQ